MEVNNDGTASFTSVSVSSGMTEVHADALNRWEWYDRNDNTAIYPRESYTKPDGKIGIRVKR